MELITRPLYPNATVMPDRELILKKISDIELDLSNRYNEIVHPGIFTGASGALFFYYYLHKLTNNPSDLEKFYAVLEDLYERLNNDEYSNTFCDGLIGVAISLNYFIEKQMIGLEDVEESLSIIDQIIIENSLVESTNIHGFDYLHGQFGALFYLLERLQFSQENEAIVVRLFEDAANTLLTEIQSEHPDKDVPCGNCGLAHGNISFIAIFSRFLERYPENEIVRTSLETLVRHQLSFINPDKKNSFSLFPSIVKNRSEIHYNIIAGWCYGDPTAIITLFRAADIMGDDRLKTLCMELSEHVAARDTIEKAAATEQTDAGLCHGMASIALNNRILHEITGKEKFHQNYCYFVEAVLKRGNSPESVSGFRKYLGEGEYEDLLNLLDGSMGIGLFLITTLLEEPTDWERLFLWK
jgi:lantibiotic modifying enzyme